MMPENEKILLQNEIIKTITDLIKIRSIAGSKEALLETKAYIKNFFKETELNVREYSFNDIPALVITTYNTKTPQIFLQGHVDVVDGENDQFIPRFEGDMLFGRGTADMKGFDAIAMHLLKKNAKKDKPADLGLMLTFDEESGSENGASQLAGLDYNCDILINGDAGYNHVLVFGEKGILKFKLVINTNPGRHPYPWQGENAFDKLIKNYNNVISLFPEQNIATDEDNWYTTYSAYDIKVQNNEFYPCHHAELKMNVYFTEDFTAKEYFDKISDKRDADVEMIPLLASERVFIDVEDENYMLFQQILSDELGVQFQMKTENGSSDARFFTNRDISILILRVVGGDHHGPNEYLHIPSIMPLYESLDRFIAIKGKKEVEEVKNKSEKIDV